MAKTQDELKQVHLDLTSEAEVRRKWQEEVNELKEQEKKMVSVNPSSRTTFSFH